MDYKKNPRTDFKDPGKLSHEEARGEVVALREGIEHHNYLYYVKNQQEINVFAMAIRLGLTADDLKEAIWAYPTSISDIAFFLA